jgi:hypothetical protein
MPVYDELRWILYSVDQLHRELAKAQVDGEQVNRHRRVMGDESQMLMADSAASPEATGVAAEAHIVAASIALGENNETAVPLLSQEVSALKASLMRALS